MNTALVIFSSDLVMTLLEQMFCLQESSLEEFSYEIFSFELASVIIVNLLSYLLNIIVIFTPPLT